MLNKKGCASIPQIRPEEQMKIMLKSAQSVITEEEPLEKPKRSAAENRPLTIKLGLHPAAPDIRLGRAVVLRKVGQRQEAGAQGRNRHLRLCRKDRRFLRGGRLYSFE